MAEGKKENKTLLCASFRKTSVSDEKLSCQNILIESYEKESRPF
jgi:hypothetical protein